MWRSRARLRAPGSQHPPPLGARWSATSRRPQAGPTSRCRPTAPRPLGCCSKCGLRAQTLPPPTRSCAQLSRPTVPCSPSMPRTPISACASRTPKPVCLAETRRRSLAATDRTRLWPISSTCLPPAGLSLPRPGSMVCRRSRSTPKDYTSRPGPNKLLWTRSSRKSRAPFWAESTSFATPGTCVFFRSWSIRPMS